MNKVVYLIEQPLDERNYERFGIQTWIDRGWDVEVWDLTPLAYPQVWKKYIESGGKLRRFDGYFCIAATSELNHRDAELKKICCFIDLTGDHFHSILVKKRLKQAGAKRIVARLGSIPVSIKRNGLIKKIRQFIGQNPIKSSKQILDKLLIKLMVNYICPDLIIISGSKSALSVTDNTKLIKAHNFDYDIYLGSKSSLNTPVKPYAVFIDQNLCAHPDVISEGWEYPATAEKYYSSVSHALCKIEDSLGFDLCIAANPRATYLPLGQDGFREIPVKFGATAELIRDCSVVVCHYSTAAQFAILFGKPAIFITTDELEATECRTFINDFAQAFGKVAVNIDRDLAMVDWNKELGIDSEKYDSYKNAYIKTNGSPEKPIWEIVIDYMENSKNLR